ncbi:MAG: hypothetical protein ACM3PT_11970 [Deltaproteobacteria bacterium]
MRNLVFSLKLILFLAAFSFIASCTKETDDPNLEEDILGIRTDELTTEDCVFSFSEMQTLPVDALDVEAMPHPRPDKCFKLNYPVTIQFPDQTTATVNSKEEMANAIKTWRQNNPDVQGRPKLVFPVSITMKDGTVKTINNELEMKGVMFECLKKFRHVRLWTCVDLVFPVTVVFPDGTTVVVNSREELKTAITNWRQNNADVEGHAKIQFPFDVKLKNGEIVTINNLEDLKALIKKCIRQKKYKRFG